MIGLDKIDVDDRGKFSFRRMEKEEVREDRIQGQNVYPSLMSLVIPVVSDPVHLSRA